MRWVQYPRVRRVRRIAPAGRVPASLLIASVFLVVIGLILLAVLGYTAHLIT